MLLLKITQKNAKQNKTHELRKRFMNRQSLRDCKLVKSLQSCEFR